MDHKDNQRMIYRSATYHTMEDVERHEIEFTLCLPNDYRSCRMALVNYEFVLEKIIGGQCPHWEWVQKIRDVWIDKEKELEPVVTTWHCVHLLRAIHHDVRTFFWNCVSWRHVDICVCLFRVFLCPVVGYLYLPFVGCWRMLVFGSLDVLTCYVRFWGFVCPSSVALTFTL